MSTSPAEPPSGGGELGGELERLREEHEAEIRSLNREHAAMLASLRESFAFRLGDALIGLRSATGRRAFPRRMRALLADIRDYRRATHRNPPPTPDHDPPHGALTLSVLDDFSEQCLAPEVRLRRALRHGGVDQFEGVSLLLVESAWQGNGGEWLHGLTRYPDDPDLGRLLDAARRSGIPSVFWNKEDPVGYEEFLPVAREFDVVLTTDLDRVAHYARDLGHGRVGALMFAAQPRLHHPIRGEPGPRTGSCFAGAWRGSKYPDRARDLVTLLDAASDVGDLSIYARDAKSRVGRESGFPERFVPHVRDPVPYASMGDVYRRHACMLNVNSVAESPTMLSRRVLEAMACRTPVISSPSEAITRNFDGLVQTPAGPSETRAAIEWTLTEPDEAIRLAHRAYRSVHLEHTYADRIQVVLEAAGLDIALRPWPEVEVICVSNRPELFDAAISNYERQDYRARRLAFVTNHDGFDRAVEDARIREIPGARALHLPAELTLGECLNAAVDTCGSEWFAKFDDDDYYGSRYLTDFMIAARFSGAPVMGKQACFAYLGGGDRTILRHEDREFTWTDHVLGATIVARRVDVGGIPFRPLARGADTQFLKDCSDAGLSILSSDRYNYLMMRGRSDEGHTWTVSESALAEEGRVVASGPALELVEV